MFFFLFLSSIALLVTSALVAFSTVPVNSIVFLVATFINAALMLFFFGVDFLSLIFIIVYVGAIAILFLFVVMMVSIKTKIVNVFSVHSLLNLLKGVWLYFFLFFILISFFNTLYFPENYFLLQINIILLDGLSGIGIFGQALYNYFAAAFLLGGLVLLISLLGSCLLTLEYYFFFFLLSKIASRFLKKNSQILFFSLVFIIIFFIVLQLGASIFTILFLSVSLIISINHVVIMAKNHKSVKVRFLFNIFFINIFLVTLLVGSTLFFKTTILIFFVWKCVVVLWFIWLIILIKLFFK